LPDKELLQRKLAEWAEEFEEDQELQEAVDAAADDA
jgi:predicted house-cleaning noncanonical NTP pyrophosphatase (MazG superfamily)